LFWCAYRGVLRFVKEFHYLLGVCCEAFGPRDEFFEELADEFAGFWVGEVACCVDVVLGLGHHDFRFVNGVHVKEDEDLPQVVLGAGSAETSRRGAHEGDGFAVEGVVLGRSAGAVNCVFEDAGDTIVVLWRGDKESVSGADFRLKLSDKRGRLGVEVLVIGWEAAKAEDFDGCVLGAEFYGGFHEGFIVAVLSKTSDNAEYRDFLFQAQHQKVNGKWDSKEELRWA
jgi:hypothetical protein